MPLIGVTSEKSVEVLKTQTARPQVKRTRLAGHPVRDIMHLPKPGRVVAILSQTLSDGACTLRYDGIVAGVPSGKLSNDPACDRVVVSPRDQRRTRWRTKRGGVEHVIAKSTVRDALEVRRLNGSTECTARSESDIIRKDQKNVWSARRCFDSLWEIRHRILYRPPDLAFELRLGLRQHLLPERCWQRQYQPESHGYYRS